MELDDKKRSFDGVVACIRDEGDKVRLIFDDVESNTQENPISWRFHTFFTWTTFDKKKVLESELTSEQYADIGFNLMARLAAIYTTSNENQVFTPDPQLTTEDEVEVAKLSESQVQMIDTALLSNTTERWRKVAMVVAMTMNSMPDTLDDIPDIYYGQRVRKFVRDGVLESQGNLASMRFAEVRLRTQTDEQDGECESRQRESRGEVSP
jgi:hypothetical protein